MRYCESHPTLSIVMLRSCTAILLYTNRSTGETEANRVLDLFHQSIVLQTTSNHEEGIASSPEYMLLPIVQHPDNHLALRLGHYLSLSIPTTAPYLQIPLSWLNTFLLCLPEHVCAVDLMAELVLLDFPDKKASSPLVHFPQTRIRALRGYFLFRRSCQPCSPSMRSPKGCCRQIVR